jgi:RES domain
LLEQTSISALKAQKNRTERLIAVNWHLYTELAQQREKIKDELCKALLTSSIKNYKFKNWQRAVKYRYALHPLSTQGSFENIGGRFSTGNAVHSQVPSFSALYVAEDKDTSLQEHLGQEPSPDGLTPREIALTNPTSETIVSISGQLENIFDLTQIAHLDNFVELIKDFKLSKQLRKEARELQLKINDSIIIQSSKKLCLALLDPHWRRNPACFDIPSNSQIFGHLIYLAGIEGILYPSKFTKKLCLALFPSNFANTDSYVSLDDTPPHSAVPTRIDGQKWRISELSFEELNPKDEKRH